MLPIPKHLNDILKPTGEKNDESRVTGKIVCTCGSEGFTLLFSGDDSDYDSDKVIKVLEINDNYFLIVKAHCNSCGKEHLIFDRDFHGWEAFVCGSETKDMPRPETKSWSCHKCGRADHALTLTIDSQGPEDFNETAGEEFDKNDWTEAFDWISIKTECTSCRETNNEWVSCETM